MVRPDWLRPHGTPWVRGEATPVFENPWIRVTQYAATAPTGAAASYGLVSFKNLAIAILPIFEDGTTVLVGQHRFPAGDYSWEIPEGGGPLDSDPLESARRELAEETGLQAAAWTEILQAQLSNSVTDERAIGYLATGLSPARGAHPADDTEALAQVRIPFREAVDAAAAGHLKDSLTVAMLLKAFYMAQRGLLAPALARAMLA
jgi:8-oxo-dGTP pyrophosphatase MutT (NUDIX family)